MNRTKSIYLPLLAVLLSPVIVGNSHAAYIVLTDLTSFSGNEALIDFEGVAGTQGTPVPNVDGVSFALSSSGIAPRLSTQDTGPRPFGPPGSAAIDPAASGAPFSPYDDLSIGFTDSVNRVAFVLNVNIGRDVDVTVRNSGVVVEQISFTPAGGFNFFGFETDDLFNELLIEVDDSIGFGFWRFDNLRYESSDVSPVPEPGTLALLGLGLFGIGLARLRTKA